MIKSIEEKLNWLSFAEDAAKSAGIALSARGFSIVKELPHDIKSEADLNANHRIIGVLESSGIPILSEEDLSEEAMTLLKSGLVWVVDPLDGTINYTKGIPLCCVSIALWDRMEPVLGVVYDFERGQLYSGGPDLGAKCNGEPIRVSGETKPSRGVLATGFPSGRSYESEELRAFVDSMQKFRKVRLLGSAALSLAWVARGWLDAYNESGIYFWDVAAGLAIVKAAGGEIDIGLDEASFPRCEASAFASPDLLRSSK
ncbi:inositol monophosphatase family protein [Pelagicoccus albus]|uniref:Inositol monophosphatase n=1 Tax=Pelagicoccus albus TaxID=415222 RepID=A0A7X1B9Q3_9BACT|nr:inositol monophosphatase family protein [Pelagicoccus albus]MBC2606945.1 inositol monophosphatase [Pelagicoccus albus]